MRYAAKEYLREEPGHILPSEAHQQDNTAQVGFLAADTSLAEGWALLSIGALQGIPVCLEDPCHMITLCHRQQMANFKLSDNKYTLQQSDWPLKIQTSCCLLRQQAEGLQECHACAAAKESESDSDAA